MGGAEAQARLSWLWWGAGSAWEGIPRQREDLPGYETTWHQDEVTGSKQQKASITTTYWL